jgi:DNA-binding MarR family transcriptional regulator
VQYNRNMSSKQDEIAAFQVATRDLVGVALRSLDALKGEVSLAQFRLLFALHELGRCPSSQVARALGVQASSVTRLADRLFASGHVQRGTDPRSRRVVVLELTDRGKQLVEAVLAQRRAEIVRYLDRMPPEERAAAAAGLRCLHEVIIKEADAQYSTEMSEVAAAASYVV